MVALPRLRTDLHVEARSDVHGAYYRLTSADGARSHRLSQPAYMALSMLDGRFGWQQWSTSVQTVYPQVTHAHMIDLLREVSAMGFLDGELILPGDPRENAAPPPAAPPPAAPPPGRPAMMLSDLEADFHENARKVPLEVTGIGHAPVEAPIVSESVELETRALEALFSPSADNALDPQATQITAPPSEMEDPYLHELGPADLTDDKPKGPPEQPPLTDEVRVSLASDLGLDLDSDFSSEEPPEPPSELSNPDLVASDPFPEPDDMEGMDVQFTEHSLPALARASENAGFPELAPVDFDAEDLPVAMGMESTEGAALLDAIALPGGQPQEALFTANPTERMPASEVSRSDVSTVVAGGNGGLHSALTQGDLASSDFSQDAIPTATDISRPIVGTPQRYPLAGALPPFDFTPESNPKNLGPIPGHSGGNTAPFPGALPSLEGPPEPTFDPLNQDAFSAVESREKPKVFGTLQTAPANEAGLLRVTAPSGKSFQIYDLEYQLMQLLDGQRDLAELQAAFAKRGHPVDLAQLSSFIRQMNAYGFLESCGPIVPATSLPPQMPWKEGPPQVADALDQWPAEERRLFQQGLTHFRDANFGRAEGYFNALIEINPENPEALAMLALMKEGPMAVNADVEEAPAKAQGSAGRTGFFLFLLVVTLVMGAGMVIERPTTTTTAFEIVPATAATVKTAVDGVVGEVFLTQGATVKVGEPLLRLAADDLLPQEAATKAEVAERTQQLAILQGSADERKALVAAGKVAAKEFTLLERSKRALEKAAKRGSKRSRKKAQDKLDPLLPRLEEARTAAEKASAVAAVAAKGDDSEYVESIVQALETAKAQAKALAKARAERVITAPYSGTVATIAVNVGDALVADGAVATIERQGAFDTEILLPEAAINLIELGGPVSLRMLAFPDETYRGTVTKVGTSVEEVDGDRIIRVHATLVDDTERLKPKMSGTAAFTGVPMPVTLLVWQKATSWLKLHFIL